MLATAHYCTRRGTNTLKPVPSNPKLIRSGTCTLDASAFVVLLHMKCHNLCERWHGAQNHFSSADLRHYSATNSCRWPAAGTVREPCEVRVADRKSAFRTEGEEVSRAVGEYPRRSRRVPKDSRDNSMVVVHLNLIPCCHSCLYSSLLGTTSFAMHGEVVCILQ